MLTHLGRTPDSTPLKLLKTHIGTTFLIRCISLHMQIGQVILTYPYAGTLASSPASHQL